MSHPSTVVKMVIQNRISNTAEELPEEEAGFRPRRSTAEQLSSTVTSLEKIIFSFNGTFIKSWLSLKRHLTESGSRGMTCDAKIQHRRNPRWSHRRAINSSTSSVLSPVISIHASHCSPSHCTPLLCSNPPSNEYCNDVETSSKTICFLQLSSREYKNGRVKHPSS